MNLNQELDKGRQPRDREPVRVDSAEGSPNSALSPSIGGYLAAQRRLRGISRKQLCHQTQIPLRSLERLESGVFDGVDDGFVRGFVRTVAEALGLDMDDTLARMSQEPTSTDESARVLAAAGLLRIGALVVGLALVLLSVGLVGVVLKFVPGQNSASELVTRRDPVRVLAQARGGSSLGATEVLVPLASPHLPGLERPSQPGDALRVPQPGFASPVVGETLRADAATDAATAEP